MKKWIILILWIFATPAVAEPANTATFSYFDYSGRDPSAGAIPLGAHEYRNPIIPGFHPDPSVVRVGRDYFLVNSSFAFFPGLPVFHSRDLVNWKQIGNALDRPNMLDLTGIGTSFGTFAPTIRYHTGLFYIINTCAMCGGNFVITARNPAGPWSDPKFLPSVADIDPDLFFDDDSKVGSRAWIANNGPPAGPPKYAGHRAIWLQEFDLKTMSMIGRRSIIVDGGVHFADKPIWTEGPHIYKRGGWYYLMTAEGGTAGNHSETIYRARRVTGPYFPGPVNPILTQRDLDPARPFPVYATGHADIVQTDNGRWWSVFLGTRPYRDNLSSMGRETFLLPVSWPKDGWPLILPPQTPVPQAARGPSSKTDYSRWRDEFTDAALRPEWLMLRTPKQQWYSLSAHPGVLTITPLPVSLGGLRDNPSFIGIRQQHNDATVETELRYTPVHDGDRAGLALFADERHYYFLGLLQDAGVPVLAISLRNGGSDGEDGNVITSLPITTDKAIRLRITAHGGSVDFSYALSGADWKLLLANADGKMLASEVSNQFTGTVIGPYAASAARPFTNLR